MSTGRIGMSTPVEKFSPADERVRATISHTVTRKLCDHCLGRLVGRIGHGYSNDERGRMIRAEYALEAPNACVLCEGLFERLDAMADAVLGRLSEIEVRSFSMGSRCDPLMIDREESIWTECGGEYAEPIKVEVNREVGKRVEKRSGKIVDIHNPDVTCILDVNFFDIDLEISSLFIYGRYQKHDRTIPQTRWPCRRCMGKGCKACDFTGKKYQESVEELIRHEFMEAAEGQESALHGMGREDIDARMLGNGRPFILELKRPRRRTLDLIALTDKTNASNEGRVRISAMRYSSKAEVRELKNAEPDKSYRIVVEFPFNMNCTKLINAIKILSQSQIEQRTPKRVSHRRADRIRQRRIFEIEMEGLEGRMATVSLRASSGTYIKELMNGDGGRTNPNLAALLETDVRVVQLDVIAIHDESDNDGQGI